MPFTGDEKGEADQPADIVVSPLRLAVLIPFAVLGRFGVPMAVVVHDGSELGLLDKDQRGRPLP